MQVDTALTQTPAPNTLRSPDDWPRPTPTIDFELGGQSIGDSSTGHEVQVWRAWIDGNTVKCAPESDLASAVALFTRPGIWHVGLAFDQLMRPCVTFMDGAGCWLWWYDSLESAMVFLQIPGGESPRITLDDKRAETIGGSDVVLGYIRARQLCIRLQRERYATEHVLLTLPANLGRLDRIGMNLASRLQYVLAA